MSHPDALASSLALVDAECVQRFPIQDLFAVVALFDPLAVGTTISRQAWPAHVTLASNFRVDVSIDELVLAVHPAGALDKPLVMQIAGSALFGPNHDVPVQLVESEDALAAHHHLAGQLELVSGFAAEEPAYWRDGYRPHVTRTPATTIGEGSRRSAHFIAIVGIVEDDATVVAIFDLPKSL